ncbi:MAG TPA: hypothetical protein PK402_03335 [Tepidisphaeraceae bacterium]|nr:hypothetical protein [Tepidisphaeraceae bacterium]
MNKDPTRFVTHAARAMLVLGIVQLLISTCVGIGAFAEFVDGGIPKGPALFVSLFMVLIILALLGSGATLILCGVKIKRGRHWAAITGLVLSVGFCLMYLLMAVSAGVQIYATRYRDPAQIVMAAFLLLLMLAFASTFSYCRRSFAGLKLMSGYQGRGFEVQMAQPVDATLSAASTREMESPPVLPPRPKL